MVYLWSPFSDVAMPPCPSREGVWERKVRMGKKPLQAGTSAEDWSAEENGDVLHQTLPAPAQATPRASCRYSNGRGIVIVKIKIKWRTAGRISRADKTNLTIQTKLNLAHFARLTWPASFLAYASRNHKQDLHCFTKLIRRNR